MQLTREQIVQELQEKFIQQGNNLTAAWWAKNSKAKGQWQKHWEKWSEFTSEVGLKKQAGNQPTLRSGGPRAELGLKDGVVFVGSDAHYWPGEVSTAHRAYVQFAKQLKPDVVVMNGDALDGAGIGRWPSIGWENKPTIKQEMEVLQDRLHEIFEAAPNAKRIWTLGNHDMRFESLIANKLPELAKVQGVHLKDHYPAWTPAWSVMVNSGYHRPCMIKHRITGGVHAKRNNILRTGCHTVTGHLHAQGVHRHRNYLGTWYGVDAGTMLEPGFGKAWGPEVVHYTEDNPLDWGAGFVVLTFKDYELMPPDLVEVIEPGVVWFRGERISV